MSLNASELLSLTKPLAVSLSLSLLLLLLLLLWPRRSSPLRGGAVSASTRRLPRPRRTLPLRAEAMGAGTGARANAACSICSRRAASAPSKVPASWP